MHQVVHAVSTNNAARIAQSISTDDTVGAHNTARQPIGTDDTISADNAAR
jgi:hypothetical protein